MLVYGSLVVDGMVLLGYDNGFYLSLSFFGCHGVLGFISQFWSLGCRMDF